MPDSSVPRTRDTSGTLDQIDVRTTPNGDLRQVVTVGNDGDNVAGVEAFGALTVNMGPTTLFYDSWTNALDTTDLWTTVGTAPTVASGNMTMSATASTYNVLRTKDTIKPTIGFVYVANGVQIETTTTTGAGRFWGLGTQATTPAAAVLAQDGIGFELDQATGSLLAVTYAAGVRTTVATLNRPTDGILHRYALHFRVTQAYWYIDNLQIPVASQAFPNVTVANLPAIIVRQNAAAFTGTPVFTNTAHATGDTSRSAQAIGDPVLGTRQARVTASGALQVAQRGQETVGTAANNIVNARSGAVGTSAAVLVAAPAAGLSIYITDVSVGNSGATLSTVQLLPTGGTVVLDIPAAASGGGGSMNFATPIKITAGTGLSVQSTAASTSLFCTVTGYIAL